MGDVAPSSSALLQTKVRKLGKGAFGQVILYSHLADKQLVAVKELALRGMRASEKASALKEG